MIRLSESFLAPYRQGKIKTNFGPVGAVTYYRTYSRKAKSFLLDSGKVVEAPGMMEHWVDTCQRVIEGNFNLIENDPTATIEKAEKHFHYLFKMGTLPPGRSLWVMGTKYAQERGGDALNNCWFVAVRPQSYENMEMYQDGEYLFSDPFNKMPSFPFVFMFDRAMCGGGVGFSNQKKNMEQFSEITNKVNLKIYLDKNHPDWEYIKNSPDYESIKDLLTDDWSEAYGHYIYDIQDSRQGWGMGYREIIDAHWAKETKGEHISEEINLCFDMSKIRGYGEPIKGFGGTSSGPLPLMVLFKNANDILNNRFGEKLTSVDALDLMNQCGRCVVSGNVRRTALIAIGGADDKEYVDAKNYTLVAPIMEKDENGYVKWDNGKQVRRPYKDVLNEFIEKELKEVGIENSQFALQEDYDAAYERVQEKAKKAVDELFYMAWAQENHRWASNNSVYTDDRFEDWGFIADGIKANGEPGVINEYLMKHFGRIMDGLQENIDADAEGMNPLVA